MRRVIAAAVLCACGCSALSGLGDLERACDEPCSEPADGSIASDASTSDAGATSDGGSDGDPNDAGEDAGSCTSTKGPTMVHAGSACIDSTEVTNAQYAIFLADPAKPAQPAACTWNSSFQPSGFWPAADIFADPLPVNHVDWCDAYVYCAWAGKRLCGHVGGGPLDPSETDAAASEWYLACSAGGTLAYPYGNIYTPGTCNDGTAIDGSAPVGSLTGCTGGYPGLHDMSGNVLEWGDLCVDSGFQAQDNPCLASGGDFFGGVASLACGGADTHNRGTKQKNIGFRCCASPN